MSGVTPARRVAYTVVRRVFEEGAYADRALHGEARGLDTRDRAFAMQLAFGTVQRRLTLDHVIGGLARPVDQLDAVTLAALRLGLFQLLFLDGVGEHAAVDESVELAKGGGGHKLVNAVLRRAIREPPVLPEDDTPAGAALAHSYPRWIVEMWWEAFGPDATRALLCRGNEHGEVALRANTLVTSPEQLAADLPVATHAAPDAELPEGLVVEGPFDAHGHALWREGAYAAQSRGSMLVARTLDPQPGERVLDLCAAPGGKTTHLAALMGGEGEIVAVERHAGRAAALQRTCDRLRVPNVTIQIADAAAFRTDVPFDRVLVDPPCSGLGTLQGHPDLRWRTSPQAIEGLAGAQRAILGAAAAALRPGGTLVYATCTLSPRENEEQAAATGMRLEAERHVLPHRDRTDGFYIARLSA